MIRRIRKNSTAPGKSGFTLIEMVTAAAVFSLLGVMLFSMVKSGMTMWKDGESSRDEIERGVHALNSISRELRLAFTENNPFGSRAEAQMLCDFVDYDRDGDSIPESRVQRLAFTRINAEERENEVLKTSGDEPLGRLYFTLFENDPDLVKEMGTLPTGGLAEALFMSYAPELGEGQKSDGLLSLYRGYRSPIGGEGSFFTAGNLLKPDDIEFSLLPVLDEILHLEFRFWNQHTYTFDASLAGPDDLGGAGYTWDSTRAVLPEDPAMSPNRFRFGLGDGSRDDVTDDIFPERILITVEVRCSGGAEGLPRLTGDVKEDSINVPVDMTKPLERMKEGERFVRIDAEWIEFSSAGTGELVVKRRGARNTLVSDHKRGSLVNYGRRFSTVVEIAGAKSCFNSKEDD